MTREQVQLLIDKTNEKNASGSQKDGRAAQEIWLVLVLMYYAHMKLADVMNLTPANFTLRGGYYYSNRTKSYMRFHLSREIALYIRIFYIYYQVRPFERIIKCKRRMLHYAFRQLADECGLENCRLTDVLYAGERDAMRSRKPPRIARQQHISNLHIMNPKKALEIKMLSTKPYKISDRTAMALRIKAVRQVSVLEGYNNRGGESR